MVESPLALGSFLSPAETWRMADFQTQTWQELQDCMMEMFLILRFWSILIQCKTHCISRWIDCEHDRVVLIKLGSMRVQRSMFQTSH